MLFPGVFLKGSGDLVSRVISKGTILVVAHNFHIRYLYPYLLSEPKLQVGLRVYLSVLAPLVFSLGLGVEAFSWVWFLGWGMTLGVWIRGHMESLSLGASRLRLRTSNQHAGVAVCRDPGSGTIVRTTGA